MYTDTIKDLVVDRWYWSSEARRTAVKAQIDGCTTALPDAFLKALQAVHKLPANAANHVPGFDFTLSRWLNEYELEVVKLGPADDPDDLLETIIRKWGMPPAGGITY